MNAYRVDRRLFKVGDVVTQTGEYLTKLDCQRALVEEHLERKRPSSKPRRDAVLFVFESRIAAEQFWTKEINGKLYEVDYHGGPLHRGDMNLTEEVFRVRANAALAEVVAERYWGGEESGCPQIELLVDKAVVVSVVFTTEPERRRAFAARAGIQLP